VVALSLSSPIGAAGVILFLAHPSAPSAVILSCSLIVSYGLPNGRAFGAATKSKREVIAFIDRYPGAVYLRAPAESLVERFDLSFLIPSYYRPAWLVRHVARSRVHAYTVRRGAAEVLDPSPRAFVSPISQDSYIFLRQRIEDASAAAVFTLNHEIGHAAAIFSVTAKRNLIGISMVLLSIVWTVALTAGSQVLWIWSAVQLVGAVAIDRTVFARFRAREKLNAELVADYMAMRHLSAEEIEALGGRSWTAPNDAGLTAEDNAERKAVFDDQLGRLHRGEAIDIPSVYMRETFRHPPALAGFLILHLAYLATFAWAGPGNPGVAAGWAVVATIYLLGAVAHDALLHVALSRRLDPVET